MSYESTALTHYCADELYMLKVKEMDVVRNPLLKA